ncbi:MAG: UbiA family prenyltransferase [Hyphomicrobiales bacterium]|nr:UbiA family prenyltransferase [Hyphomicrobiales bacterium]MCP5000191.1 UbiA family prenyltransferase [Hyphomicrobiales bacterium]
MPLIRRLWIYQAERIPIFRTAALLAVFSAASVNVSALLAGRSFPDWPAYAAAFLVSLVIFIQLRACDEYKDGSGDLKYRPERPIPRGLVSLRLILGIGAGLVPVAALVAWAYYPPVLILLLVVWIWMALMTVEFFVPDWLKAHPVLYLVSHMAIMPLLDLFVTGVEWLPASGRPSEALVLFLLLSFVNGCVLEIGRKIWAPANERECVETYSGLWGVNRATSVWIAMTALSFLLLLAVGLSTGHVVATGLPGLLMLVFAWRTVFAMRKSPSGKLQERLDMVSGFWVFVCYFAAGFAPLAAGLLP